ncbi:DUF1761 domain-containing protein [Oricola thermophila]|uniref:DUF1761 domain-containing protein n=1 Tax=Oricola thermophila TaxID=2742145 RepID=A0A6N1VKE5_9HYPH|nr:DUF1761 domain-containing protein [Oricola thermophila]QKV19882.1 DUF1761 domain-containing protein [Oricola thermophila]
MTFGGANYLAILVAAVAAYLAGAIYYGWLGRTWLDAARIKPEEAKMSLPLMVTGFVCELVMAWVLAGVIGHLGAVTIRAGLLAGFLLWLGFIATTQTVNHRYQGFGWKLTLIDSVHWLVVALLMGGIIGAFGV